jgi:hypothetical protein
MAAAWQQGRRKARIHAHGRATLPGMPDLSTQHSGKARTRSQRSLESDKSVNSSLIALTDILRMLPVLLPPKTAINRLKNVANQMNHSG